MILTKAKLQNWLDHERCEKWWGTPSVDRPKYWGAPIILEATDVLTWQRKSAAIPVWRSAGGSLPVGRNWIPSRTV